MKTFIAIIVAIFPYQALAYVAISEARYNFATDNMYLDVVYGGGCKHHAFSLDLIASFTDSSGNSSYSFYLNHLEGADDPCEKLLFETLIYPMDQINERPATIKLSTSKDGSNPQVITINQFPRTKIEHAFYDNNTQELVTELAYQGGCKEHNFILKINRCTLSYPPQCNAFIAHKDGTSDPCKASMHITKRFNISSKLIPSDLTLRNIDDTSFNISIR